jgi:hypothetical protein
MTTKGPFTRVIFAAILGKRFSPFGGCEGVDYLMMLL